MSYDLLEGIRVIEVSMYAFAPSCAAVLADWGADVIKVLPTEVDDPMRGNPVAGLPDKDVGVAFMWEQMNRGKRGMAIDLTKPDGQAIVHELVAGADVFITNLLPGRQAALPHRRRRAAGPEARPRVRPGERPRAEGPRGGERRLRPHRLLGPYRHRPRGEHGVRRVRAPARPRPG